MQSWDILWLHPDSLQVVLLCFLQLPNLIPAKCSVVESFEMSSVNWNSCSVVLDRTLEVSFLSKCEAPVVIEVSLPWFKINCLSEALDCFIIVSLPVKTDALVVVSEGIVGVYLYCQGVIIDGSFKVPNFVKSESSVKECLEMIGDDLNSFAVELNGSLVISLFPCSISLRMEHLCLRLLLLLVSSIALTGVGELLLDHLLLMLGRSLRDAHWASMWLIHCANVVRLEVNGTIDRTCSSSLSIMASRRHPLLSLVLRWLPGVKTGIQGIVMSLSHHHQVSSVWLRHSSNSPSVYSFLILQSCTRTE